MEELPYISILRLTDTRERIFNTYTESESKENKFLLHQHMRITPILRTTSSKMLSKLSESASRLPLVLSKGIHRFTHANPAEIIRICGEAGIQTPLPKNAIEKFDSASEVCARNGRPKRTQKVSLKHINEDLHKEGQIDFTFHDIRGEKRPLLVMTDTRAGYTETQIVAKRSTTTIIGVVENC